MIWAKEAVADRLQILDYWHKRLGSKDYPNKLDRIFREAIQYLSQFPELGREVDEQEERFIVKDYYQIFYLEEEDVIKILHIWDTRRNPDDFPL